MKKSIKITFWALVVTFVLMVINFFIPALKGSEAFLIPFIIFSLLGLILLFLILKQKVKGKIKKFLLLTGISASGIFISIFLHNVFYALAVITSHIIFLNYLMEGLHVAFFILGLIICPLGFLVGMFGTVVLFRRFLV